VHEEFLLFPTYVHEAAAGIVPEALTLLQRVQADRPPDGELQIAHAAAITEAVQVKSLEALRALRGQHIWSDAVVEDRFRRWRPDSVYAMIVRVLALPRPVRVPMRPGYAGCKSWVPLEEDVETAGAHPVLTDTEFDARVCAIRIALGLS
jgi:hypothetical protein